METKEVDNMIVNDIKVFAAQIRSKVKRYCNRNNYNKDEIRVIYNNIIKREVKKIFLWEDTNNEGS
jgi:hypothetical protein